MASCPTNSIGALIAPVKAERSKEADRSTQMFTHETELISWRGFHDKR